MRDIEEIKIKYYEHNGYVYLHEPLTNYILGPFKTKEEADENKDAFLSDLIIEGGIALDLW